MQSMRGLRAADYVGIVHNNLIIPAQAGIQDKRHGDCGSWTPAFAGMTGKHACRIRLAGL